jgi:hypothetical protein
VFGLKLGRTGAPEEGISEWNGRARSYASVAYKTHLVNSLCELLESIRTVYTDELSSYNRIAFLRDSNDKPLAYRHRRIKHSDGVYVRGDIHTNSVEGFWSLIKNGIRGVYRSISPEYLQSYLDE